MNFEDLRFESVPEDQRPRALYFFTLQDVDAEALNDLGYAPQSVLAMPRRTEAELEAWHKAVLQGIAEGTITPSKEQREAIELELKTRDRLDKSKFKDAKNSAKNSKALEEALSWRASRHVMSSSTVVDPRTAIYIINKLRSMTMDDINHLVNEADNEIRKQDKNK